MKLNVKPEDLEGLGYPRIVTCVSISNPVSYIEVRLCSTKARKGAVEAFESLSF